MEPRKGRQRNLRAGQTVKTIPQLTRTEATNATRGGRKAHDAAQSGGQKMMEARRGASALGRFLFGSITLII